MAYPSGFRTQDLPFNNYLQLIIVHTNFLWKFLNRLLTSSNDGGHLGFFTHIKVIYGDKNVVNMTCCHVGRVKWWSKTIKNEINLDISFVSSKTERLVSSPSFFLSTLSMSFDEISKMKYFHFYREFCDFEIEIEEGNGDRDRETYNKYSIFNRLDRPRKIYDRRSSHTDTKKIYKMKLEFLLVWDLTEIVVISISNIN